MKSESEAKDGKIPSIGVAGGRAARTEVETKIKTSNMEISFDIFTGRSGIWMAKIRVLWLKFIWKNGGRGRKRNILRTET